MMRWSASTNLWLFTPAEFNLLPDGFEVVSIQDEKRIKGTDYIDDDTRFGHMAYGVYSPLSHPESELLSRIALTTG